MCYGFMVVEQEHLVTQHGVLIKQSQSALSKIGPNRAYPAIDQQINPDNIGITGQE